jgi:hypothetical protein
MRRAPCVPTTDNGMRHSPDTLPWSPAPICRRIDGRQLRSDTDIVAAYIRDYRSNANRFREFFQRCPTLERAFEFAALCRLPSGKRHPHQRRLKAAVLAEAHRRLLASALAIRGCVSFDELHLLVKDRIGSLRGIGALTVYDISNHIGAHLGLEPEVVYLHAGAAAGAKALGSDHRRDTLDPAELPVAFRQLRPREVEDCLCLFKDELGAIRN